MDLVALSLRTGWPWLMRRSNGRHLPNILADDEDEREEAGVDLVRSTEPKKGKDRQDHHDQSDQVYDVVHGLAPQSQGRHAV